jgi:hypothetical protein
VVVSAHPRWELHAPPPTDDAKDAGTSLAWAASQPSIRWSEWPASTTPLAANAPAGNYTVAWRVTSADGHPVTGTLHFIAQAVAGKPKQNPARPRPPTRTQVLRFEPDCCW